MNERILKINEELRKLQESLNGDVNEEMLKEIRAKKDALVAERDRLIAQEKEELRKSFEVGTDKTAVVRSSEEVDPFKGLNKREKLCLAIGMVARKRDVSNCINKRAVGESTITTSDVFVPSSDEADGQSNGGVFVKTNLLMNLLIEKGLISGIARDISWNHIPGQVEFPYRKKKEKKAQGKAEGKGINKKQEYEWDKLTLCKGWLQSEAEITDEIRALADMDLGAYILGILEQDFKESHSIELIYADGKKDENKAEHISGLTALLTPKKYTGSYESALVTALTSLDPLYRIGAKLYVAQDVYDGVSFATDANGNFKYPVVNSTTGIQSFGTAKVEVDPMLDAGEIIAGNVSSYFLGNILIDLNTEIDRDKHRKTNTYITSMYCATKAVKEAFAYMQKDSK